MDWKDFQYFNTELRTNKKYYNDSRYHSHLFFNISISSFYFNIFFYYCLGYFDFKWNFKY